MRTTEAILSFPIQKCRAAIFLLVIALSIEDSYSQSPVGKDNIRDTIRPKIDSLQAVIVRPKTLPPRLKGDTIEYSTENIRLRVNAAVEELLGRLPGLQIDANGGITYNGEKIQHLLVDGEDIFGSDPTLITRNFDATKIARVQVLDRKSDQTVFTGVDDGSRTKTLNLVLKESEKNGYFGKVEVDGDPQGYYNANGLLASFRSKEQFTALGLASNTGTLGFSSNPGSTANISFLNGNTDALGASAGTGIPRFVATALHYANSWNGPGDHLTMNYQYSHFNTHPITTTQTLQTLPDSIYGQQQQSQSINQQDQHWVYGIYDLVPSTTTAFKFVFHGSHSEGENEFAAVGSSTFNGIPVNSSERTIKDRVDRTNVGGDISWRIRIGKRMERTLSINAGVTKIDNTSNGHIYSLNQFYQPNGGSQSMDTVDQRKQIATQSLSTGGSINYTEPLWTGALLGFSYGVYFAGDDPLQATFDRGDGKYENYIDSLSSHFKTHTVNQRATINLQGKAKHLTYTIGNDWLGYGYHQQDLLTDSVLHLRHSNLAPRVLLIYTVNQATSFNFNYTASTQQPSISQLQPVKNNNDPLHITLGNPDLRPGFNQNLRLDFHRFKTWIINLGLNLALSSNTISTKTTTDSLGRQISQPVNVDGGRMAGLNFSVNRNLLGFDAGFNTGLNYSRSVNYVNADINRNDNYTAGGGLSLRQFVPDKYSFQITSNFTYLDAISSINTTTPIRYWTQNHSGAVSLFLFPNFEINTNAIYTWQQKTSAFTANTSVLLWSAYLSRNFLQNRLVVKAQLNNILNQNAGISRTNVGNSNTETSSNILGRYWMFSAIYHFHKKAKNK